MIKGVKHNFNKSQNITQVYLSPRQRRVARSGRKPGARVTNSALAKFKVVAHGSKGVGMS